VERHCLRADPIAIDIRGGGPLVERDERVPADQQIQYPYLAGYVALYLKDYPTAIGELQKADQRDPFILVLLAQAYEKTGDTAKSREYYTQVLASNAHSLNNAFARPLARKKTAT